MFSNFDTKVRKIIEISKQKGNFIFNTPFLITESSEGVDNHIVIIYIYFSILQIFQTKYLDISEENIYCNDVIESLFESLALGGEKEKHGHHKASVLG